MGRAAAFTDVLNRAQVAGLVVVRVEDPDLCDPRGLDPGASCPRTQTKGFVPFVELFGIRPRWGGSGARVPSPLVPGRPRGSREGRGIMSTRRRRRMKRRMRRRKIGRARGDTATQDCCEARAASRGYRGQQRARAENGRHNITVGPVAEGRVARYAKWVG